MREILAVTQWRRREEVLGKDVIDAEAKKIGVTKDIAWSDDGKLAMIVEMYDETESFLSFDEVDKIGDVVFVKLKTKLQAVPAITCPMCKHKNHPEAKFCAKCGHALSQPKEDKP
jgi:sporulation protein YlmC with PRC-barrel domain